VGVKLHDNTQVARMFHMILRASVSAGPRKACGEMLKIPNDFG